MDSGFASTMMSAVDALASGFSSFTGSTIAGGVWEGDAATNAGEQVTSKIDPKVEAVKSKLNNLISAIQEAENARAAKENMQLAENAISALDPKSTSYASDLAARTSERDKYKAQFEEAVANVNSLCSG